MTLRAMLKGALETTMVHVGLAALGRRRHGARTLVLAYHNVVPDGVPPSGDTSLHLPRAAFAAQLDALAATHDVVALDQLTAPAGSDRPRAVLTFDDAYRGALTIGLAELARRNLPATFFVAPAFVGGGSFWWDALAAPGSGGPAPALRARALEALRGADAEVRSWAKAAGQAGYPVADHARVAAEADLAAAVQHPGITLASHTWSHPNLARLDADVLRAEMEKPLAWLTERFDQVVRWLSYPYGRYSPEVERAAGQAGYTGALTLEGSWIAGGTPRPFAVPRLNVPAGLSANGFRLRAAGIGKPW